MSHFAVLVVGDDVEGQLQPFHEYECTGTNDEYVQDIDVTDECRENGLDDYGLEDKTVTDEAQIDRDGEHQYGYAIVDKDGTLIKAVNRTNPDKKWDWWVEGGRWSGSLKLKQDAKGRLGRPGVPEVLSGESPDRTGYADQAKVSDIDLDGMRAEAEMRARAKYAAYLDALAAAGIAADAPFTTWEAMRLRFDPKGKGGKIEDARKAYHEQPQIEAVRSAARAHGEDKEYPLSVFTEIDQFQVPLATFVADARDEAVCFFAYVKDGKWNERGDMGWWGCVSDEMPKGKWRQEFAKMLGSLAPDETVTIVDCHI